MCPVGKALYRSQKTHEPMQCSLNTKTKSTSVDTCPKNFQCQSRIGNVVQGYCCSSQGKFKNNVCIIL